MDSWSASPSSSRFFHDIRLSMKNIISCSIVFPSFWKLWQFSKKKGWLVHHRICSLISKNNLKFGLRQVSARKQFNLYFHRMFSSFPCGYDWEVSQFKDALRGKRWLWKKQNSVLSLTKETYIQCDSCNIDMSLWDKMGRSKIVWTLSDSLLFAKK